LATIPWAKEEIKRSDEERTTWLRKRGYRVLRFWNNEVLGNMEGVLERKLCKDFCKILYSTGQAQAFLFQRAIKGAPVG
jgi:hypothetical protein